MLLRSCVRVSHVTKYFVLLALEYRASESCEAYRVKFDKIKSSITLNNSMCTIQSLLYFCNFRALRGLSRFEERS